VNIIHEATCIFATVYRVQRRSRCETMMPALGQNAPKNLLCYYNKPRIGWYPSEGSYRGQGRTWATPVYRGYKWRSAPCQRATNVGHLSPDICPQDTCPTRKLPNSNKAMQASPPAPILGARRCLSSNNAHNSIMSIIVHGETMQDTTHPIRRSRVVILCTTAQRRHLLQRHRYASLRHIMCSYDVISKTGSTQRIATPPQTRTEPRFDYK